MSRRTLYSKVKALTGQSVVEFIRNYRLRKAAQILAEEDISISMVMDRVGIDNASYFSRIFKKSSENLRPNLSSAIIKSLMKNKPPNCPLARGCIFFTGSMHPFLQ